MNDYVWLIDTNVLVYAYDFSDQRQKTAALLVERGFAMTNCLVVSLQNLTELFNALTKKVSKKLSASQATATVNQFLECDAWKKVIPQASTLLRAMKLVDAHNVHFWDAMIAAVMLENGITHIYTENVKGFAKIPGLVVKNPFA